MTKPGIAAAATLALFMTADSAGASATAEQPAYRGRFELRFRPIQCFRAPCPPNGTYEIVTGRRPSIRGRTLIIYAATPENRRRDLQALAPFIRGAIVRGAVYHDPRDGGTVTVRPEAVLGRP